MINVAITMTKNQEEQGEGGGGRGSDGFLPNSFEEVLGVVWKSKGSSFCGLYHVDVTIL
jgi:hypothetical protein